MGIIAYIYTCERGRDPLSVLPDGCQAVTVINADGPFEPTADRPAVELLATNGGGACVRAVPVMADGSKPWLMMGGRYIASSDDRFNAAAARVTGTRFYGAVALHDRFEA